MIDFLTEQSDPLTLQLNQALKRIERLITRPAESLIDPDERQAEFLRRLERTRRLMSHLGDPHRRLDFIHIGGTSGKGSVAILCEAMLRSLGQKVGTHISPYLQTALEKIRLNGKLIDPAEVIALADPVIQAAEAILDEQPALGPPHYAEAWLALALRHFFDQDCDSAIVEVGIGGRYDSTNIITPRVSVINTVHFDHMRVLGNELPAIARHKAGIVKPGVPVVVGRMPDIALGVIWDEARRNGARLIQVGETIHVRVQEIGPQGSRFSYEGLELKLDDLHIGMLGAHQVDNAATALAAVEVYAGQAGLTLEEEAIRTALKSARFAGRLELMAVEPTVVLDGAHNEEKMSALTAAIEQVFDYDRLIVVLGMLETKAARPIVEKLARLSSAMITTCPRVLGKPAIKADALADLAREAGIDSVEAVEEPLAALHRALEIARPGDLVVVTGSLYLIGTVREHWHTAAEIVARRTMFPNGHP